MAKSLNLSPAFLCLIVLLSSSVYRDGVSIMANELPVGGKQQKVWCVAKPSTSEEKLKNNIGYVCNEIGMDCGLIQRGGPCSVPATNINYASVVMNLYFQKFGRFPHNCDFLNSGLIVLTDPSYEGCLYSFGA